MFVFPRLEATCRGVIPFCTRRKNKKTVSQGTGDAGLHGNLTQGFYLSMSSIFEEPKKHTKHKAL